MGESPERLAVATNNKGNSIISSTQLVFKSTLKSRSTSPKALLRGCTSRSTLNSCSMPASRPLFEARDRKRRSSLTQHTSRECLSSSLRNLALRRPIALNPLNALFPSLPISIPNLPLHNTLLSLPSSFIAHLDITSRTDRR